MWRGSYEEFINIQRSIDDLMFIELLEQHGIDRIEFNRESIKEFYDDLKISTPVLTLFKNCVFWGSFDISEINYNYNIYFDNCTFKGKFIFDGYEFKIGRLDKFRIVDRWSDERAKLKNDAEFEKLNLERDTYFFKTTGLGDKL